MIKSIICSTLFCSILVSTYCSENYNGSTTASVTLAGAIVKAQHVDDVVKKYKRSECPVCKGKGWYISGDNIAKVECGYCEPDKKIETPPKTLIRKR